MQKSEIEISDYQNHSTIQHTYVWCSWKFSVC